MKSMIENIPAVSGLLGVDLIRNSGERYTHSVVPVPWIWLEIFMHFSMAGIALQGVPGEHSCCRSSRALDICPL
jgi:hypothetical protein